MHCAACSDHCGTFTLLCFLAKKLAGIDEANCFVQHLACFYLYRIVVLVRSLAGCVLI